MRGLWQPQNRKINLYKPFYLSYNYDKDSLGSQLGLPKKIKFGESSPLSGEAQDNPKEIKFRRLPLRPGFRNGLAIRRSYLEGQGELVSGLIRGLTRVTIWVVGEINLRTQSP